jgi:hypothetical protein
MPSWRGQEQPYLNVQTHTHTHIYICVCVYVCIYSRVETSKKTAFLLDFPLLHLRTQRCFETSWRKYPFGYTIYNQGYLFFVRGMVAFPVDSTIYSSQDVKQGMARRLRNWATGANHLAQYCTTVVLHIALSVLITCSTYWYECAVHFVISVVLFVLSALGYRTHPACSGRGG